MIEKIFAILMSQISKQIVSIARAFYLVPAPLCFNRLIKTHLPPPIPNTRGVKRGLARNEPVRSRCLSRLYSLAFGRGLTYQSAEEKELQDAVPQDSVVGGQCICRCPEMTEAEGSGLRGGSLPVSVHAGSGFSFFIPGQFKDVLLPLALILVFTGKYR